MKFNRFYYHLPESRLVPGIRPLVAIEVQRALYPMAHEHNLIRQHREMGFRMYLGTRELLQNRAARRKHKVKHLSLQFPAGYDGSHLYKFRQTPKTPGTLLPKFVMMLLQDAYDAEQAQAIMMFAEMMQDEASRRRLPDKYDVFLVLYGRVLDREVSDIGGVLAKEIGKLYVSLGIMSHGVEFAREIVSRIADTIVAISLEE